MDRAFEVERTLRECEREFRDAGTNLHGHPAGAEKLMRLED